MPLLILQMFRKHICSWLLLTIVRELWRAASMIYVKVLDVHSLGWIGADFRRYQKHAFLAHAHNGAFANADIPCDLTGFQHFRVNSTYFTRVEWFSKIKNYLIKITRWMADVLTPVGWHASDGPSTHADICLLSSAHGFFRQSCLKVFAESLSWQYFHYVCLFVRSVRPSVRLFVCLQCLSIWWSVTI